MVRCLRHMEHFRTVAYLSPGESGAAERERRREIERVHGGAAHWRECLRGVGQVRDYFELIGRTNGAGGLTFLMRRACGANAGSGSDGWRIPHPSTARNHRAVRMAMRPALPPAIVSCEDLVSDNALHHLPRRE